MMKKNRLILLLNVSVVALTPSIHGQDAADVMNNADDAVKQQLEQFADNKSAFDTEDTSSNQDTQSQQEDQSSDTSAEQSAQDESAPAVDANEESLKDQSSDTQDSSAQDAAKEGDSSEQSTQESSSENTGESTPSSSDQEQTQEAPAPVEQESTPELTPVVQAPEPVQSTDASATPEPSKPEVHAPEPEPVVAQKPQPVESLLDTIDIEEGGNWVLKRKALQDTVRKVEDINSLYDDIRDTNVVFLQGINTVDVLFTQFAYDVGLDLGKVDQLIQDVAHHLESERAQDGDLSEAERELLNKAEERKKEIEQLRANIQDIWQAHAQLKEARALNDEQIIEADRLRKQAWANFRMIERVLNEVRAEQLYYETVQLFEALRTSHRYLQTRLIPHFEQSIKTIQAKMQAVKKQSEDLQKEGVLLKEEAVHLDRQDKDQPVEEVEVPVVQTGGWLTTIKNIIWAPFGAIGSLWGWITGSSNDMSQYLPEETDNTQNAHPEEL